MVSIARKVQPVHGVSKHSMQVCRPVQEYIYLRHLTIPDLYTSSTNPTLPHHQNKTKLPPSNHHKMTPSLETLTTSLVTHTQTYLSRLQTLSHDPPNLTNPSPALIHDEAAQLSKHQILRTCETIMALVQGPVQWLMFQNMAFVDPACIGLAIELGISEIVKLGSAEPTSLDTIVEGCGCAREVVSMLFLLLLGWLVGWVGLMVRYIGRIMRVCTQRLFFEEVAPDQFVHNAVSMHVLAPPVQALISHW